MSISHFQIAAPLMIGLARCPLRYSNLVEAFVKDNNQYSDRERGFSFTYLFILSFIIEMAV